MQVVAPNKVRKVIGGLSQGKMLPEGPAKAEESPQIALCSPPELVR